MKWFRWYHGTVDDRKRMSGMFFDFFKRGKLVS